MRLSKPGFGVKIVLVYVAGLVVVLAIFWLVAAAVA